MDLTRYSELTGITVLTAQESKVIANIDKARRILEDLLGYTLDPTLVNENEYELDDITGSLRLFTYRDSDRYFHIDPASAVHAVYLERNGEVVETLETDDWHTITKHGFIKFIEQCHIWWCPCHRYHDGIQIVVDATWLWGDNLIPDDLLQVWADMTTYYSDDKSNIKSETLGPHRYEKFGNKPPEEEKYNISIIRKYAGGNGSALRQLTI